MKLVYEPGEKERIEKRYYELTKGNDGFLFTDKEPEKVYGMTFKVTNPALATYILSQMLYDPSINLDLGIDVVSINFDGLNNIPDIKEKLHKAIEEIIH